MAGRAEITSTRTDFQPARGNNETFLLLLVALENGAVLRQNAGYFTNGIFPNRAIEFEVQTDTIKVLNVVS